MTTSGEYFDNRLVYESISGRLDLSLETKIRFMKKSWSNGFSYNERLFEKNTLRGFVHRSRFIFLEQQFKHLKNCSVLELGCFDGRCLESIETSVDYYVGVDADWEGGLSTAQAKKWCCNAEFINSTTINNKMKNLRKFEYTICLETLEHIGERDIENYLDFLREKTTNSSFFTVPNEIGIFLMIKLLIKKLFLGDMVAYTGAELFDCVFLGGENTVWKDHKGFSYRDIINRISGRYSSIKVKGLPFKFLPVWMNPTVAIIAKP